VLIFPASLVAELLAFFFIFPCIKITKPIGVSTLPPVGKNWQLIYPNLEPWQLFFAPTRATIRITLFSKQTGQAANVSLQNTLVALFSKSFS
jgi:hypothetical protein